jgi:hypothetical protein
MSGTLTWGFVKFANVREFPVLAILPVERRPQLLSTPKPPLLHALRPQADKPLSTTVPPRPRRPTRLLGMRQSLPSMCTTRDSLLSILQERILYFP